MLPGERLICLHHPDVQMPHQLATFQGEKADAAGVEKLLRRLLIEPDVIPGLDPINPACEPFLKEHAKAVAERFSGPDGRQVFRPVLRQIEEDETGAAHRLEISFGEHLIGITDNPDDLQIIEAALRLAARTRGEILTRLNMPKNAEDVERVRTRAQTN